MEDDGGLSRMARWEQAASRAEMARHLARTRAAPLALGILALTAMAELALLVLLPHRLGASMPAMIACGVIAVAALGCALMAWRMCSRTAIIVGIVAVVLHAGLFVPPLVQGLAAGGAPVVAACLVAAGVLTAWLLARALRAAMQYHAAVVWARLRQARADAPEGAAAV